MTVTDWLCIAFIVWILLYPLGARFSTRNYEVIEVSKPRQGIHQQDMLPGNLYTFAEPMHPKFDGAVLLATLGCGAGPSNQHRIRTLWINREGGPMHLMVQASPGIMYKPYEGLVTIQNK